VRRSTITVSTPGHAERFIDVGLERHLLAAAQPFVGGEHDAAVAVDDAAGQRVGRKAANTIEWIAPMRAQASMATAASGTIGR
jgi:hypothetical protein